MIQYLKKKLTKWLRLKKQEEWLINLSGDVLHVTNPNWFERHILRKHTLVEIYAPKKPYTEKEQIKLGKLVGAALDGELYSANTALILINSIRPNTLDKTIAEVATSPYYQTLL
jgi:hypothetical protein